MFLLDIYENDFWLCNIPYLSIMYSLFKNIYFFRIIQSVQQNLVLSYER